MKKSLLLVTLIVLACVAMLGLVRGIDLMALIKQLHGR